MYVYFSNVNISIYLVNNDFQIIYMPIYNVEKSGLYIFQMHSLFATINIKTNEICW